MEENTQTKNIFSIASNVMLAICAVMMVVTVWLQYESYTNILAIFCVTASACGILFTGIGSGSLRNFIKQLNIYTFIVIILIAVSILISSQVLLYIGIGLFALTLILFFIPIVVEATEKRKQQNKK